METCAACWQSRPVEDMGTLIPPPPARRVRVCRECINFLWHSVQPVAVEQRAETEGE